VVVVRRGPIQEESGRDFPALVLPEDQAIDHPSRNACASLTPSFPSPSKWRQLLLCWALALGLSALLVWSGRHWPLPLLQQAWALRQPEAPLRLALALVLLPPLLMALLLLVRWQGQGTAGGGLHPDRGESSV
jgi:hypothetical protein